LLLALIANEKSGAAMEASMPRRRQQGANLDFLVFRIVKLLLEKGD